MLVRTHLDHGIEGLEVQDGERAHEEEARDHARDEHSAGDDGLSIIYVYLMCACWR